MHCRVHCESNCVLAAAGQQLTGGTAAAAKSPASPLFVTVPPRTQKLVHSETYLRWTLVISLV